MTIPENPDPPAAIVRSTGPRTVAGKARAAGNAVTHGLTAAAPVLPGEDPAGWEAHRAGVVAALAPAGALEQALADRVAAGLWRLRRVLAYETAVTAVSPDGAADTASDPTAELVRAEEAAVRKAERERDEHQAELDSGQPTLDLFRGLPDLADDAPVDAAAAVGALHDLTAAVSDADGRPLDLTDPKRLAAVGVPAGFTRRPDDWAGWTAGHVRRAAELAAGHAGLAAEEVLAEARADRERWATKAAAEVERWNDMATDRRRRADGRRLRAVVRAGLPDPNTLDRVVRYEAHLARQTYQALHTLERLQAGRLGGAVVPPLAVDVTVDAPAG